MIIKSVNTDSYLGVPIPPPEEDDIRIDVDLCCFNIRVIGPEETHVSLLICSDPKISWIPETLINWGTKQFIVTFMDMIRKRAD
mmetsp:Transcript_22890/g.3768  ORF Transcript_22890/g.3768 Transcript_22890/m.3768 type:complete len:84 (-) Transcript_22890:136-387(-)